MQWIRDFQLFLFDFDGLLVNTEHQHYQAYLNVFEKRGLDLPFTFANFLELAHFNSKAWREAIFARLPETESIWDQLYIEKVACYKELLINGKVELMAGVEELLSALKEENIRRCVVTNSLFEQIELIRAQIPILETIPHWITRENYEKPKPNPECYLKAIQMHGEKGDRIIGFEDSVRGLKALRGTPALPILIAPSHHPLLDIALEEGGIHFESMNDISKDVLVKNFR